MIPPEVQMVMVRELKVTALPEAPPVAVTINGAALLSTDAAGLKIMACAPWLMVMLAIAEEAA